MDTRRTYGRRTGRKLRTKKRALMEALLPQVTANVENPDPYKTLEIGFGTGHHLALQAQNNPGTLMVGCEPFLNGVAHMLEMIEDQNLSNVHIHPGDALSLMPNLKDDSLDSIFLLFPDPWPKKAHHKRRFVQKETLSLLAQKLSPEGRLLIATDHADYLQWILEKTTTHPYLELLTKGPTAWLQEPDLWVQTRFQAKAHAASRIPHFLTYKKIP